MCKTSVTAQELAIIQQAVQNKDLYASTGGIHSAAGKALHDANLALQAQLQAIGSPFASAIEGESAAALQATLDHASAEYANQQANTSSQNGGDASGGGSSTPGSAAGGTTSGSQPTSFLGSIGQGFNNLVSGIGSAVNTVTGSTGQTRFLQWSNLALPVVVVVGVIVWMVRGFRLSIKRGQG